MDTPPVPPDARNILMLDFVRHGRAPGTNLDAISLCHRLNRLRFPPPVGTTPPPPPPTTTTTTAATAATGPTLSPTSTTSSLPDTRANSADFGSPQNGVLAVSPSLQLDAFSGRTHALCVNHAPSLAVTAVANAVVGTPASSGAVAARLTDTASSSSAARWRLDVDATTGMVTVMLTGVPITNTKIAATSAANGQPTPHQQQQPRAGWGSYLWGWCGPTATTKAPDVGATGGAPLCLACVPPQPRQKQHADGSAAPAFDLGDESDWPVEVAPWRADGEAVGLQRWCLVAASAPAATTANGGTVDSDANPASSSAPVVWLVHPASGRVLAFGAAAADAPLCATRDALPAHQLLLVQVA